MVKRDVPRVECVPAEPSVVKVVPGLKVQHGADGSPKTRVLTQLQAVRLLATIHGCSSEFGGTLNNRWSNRGAMRLFLGSLGVLDVDLMNPWSYWADWICEVCQDPDPV